MVWGGAVVGFAIGGVVVLAGLQLVDRVIARRIRRAARLSRARLRLP